MKIKIILFILRCVARFPLGVLYLLSDFLYIIVYYVVGYRRKVVRKNLMEAFPDLKAREIGKIEREYYSNMCDIIVETVKLLHISDAEMSNRVRVENLEEVLETVERGKSVALLLGHYANWEWVQEISRYIPDGIFKATIYHPLKNKMWDSVYKVIRSRWHTEVIPQRYAVRKLLDPANRPWVCGFIVDNRPDNTRAEAVVPFLNHYTSFIYGAEEIGAKIGAEFFFLEMIKESRGHYRIVFHRLKPESDGLPYPYTRNFWSKFENVIKKSAAYWLWSHKRWKKDKQMEF